LRISGKKDGIIVVAGHYDTLYSQPKFVGANDGGSSTALLLAFADSFAQATRRLQRVAVVDRRRRGLRELD